MFQSDRLRQHQEQRLKSALDSWNEAKKILESAIAFAEGREKEYSEVAEDVRLKLEALQIVVNMTAQLEDEQSAGPRLAGNAVRPELAAPGNTKLEPQTTSRALPTATDSTVAATPHTQTGVVRVVSRKLFAPNWRSPDTKSSILQLK